MEKINIAALIKNCPKGMELDCITWENVTFEKVMDNKIFIRRNDKPSFDNVAVLNKYGCAADYLDEKCIIFPKGKTTWEGFVPPCKFKDGDIVFYDNCVSIFKEWGDETLFRNYVKVDIGGGCPMLCDRTHSNGKGIKREARFATEEEKAKLFKSIRDNGYKWNPETKTLENLFSYNIGKKVWVKSDKEHKYVHTIVGISRNSFGNLEYEVKEEKSGVVVHYPESLLIPITTKELKFKVGDRITFQYYDRGVAKIVGISDDEYKLDNGKTIPFQDENAYEISNEKFDIANLKPFDKVLVRNTNNGRWQGQFYMDYDKNEEYPFECTYNCWMQCIPYKGNEHLRGTATDCDEYFKTWK